MKTKANQQNIFVRLITSPYRAFCRARDFYVNSMIQCATGNAAGLRGGGGAALHAADLPRSFSVNSVRSDDRSEDFRELVRAASARSGRVTAAPPPAPPRSVSVGMGRIDEDQPRIDFGEEIDARLKKEVMKYNRSKSQAGGAVAGKFF
ncbi:uncharacterized protein LOC127264475 [Andrographis paniculata]|uniref:uncharacterized protein LOC127264475 n=1 Tax=Andrographis paniculata TaxID=175694 RepID=UPI0021E907D6|nr:uncharacterized protein LOC127264475 [Andrographis paniculata]